jgi:hypothetical protein
LQAAVIFVMLHYDCNSFVSFIQALCVFLKLFLWLIVHSLCVTIYTVLLLFTVIFGWTMQVSVGQHSCTGTGPNKKLAKRAAAEGLLQMLGYSRPAAQAVKSSIKAGDTNQDMDKSRKV